MHNCASDCWLSWLGRVYDLTDLMAEHTGSVIQPLSPFLSSFFPSLLSKNINGLPPSPSPLPSLPPLLPLPPHPSTLPTLT